MKQKKIMFIIKKKMPIIQKMVILCLLFTINFVAGDLIVSTVHAEDKIAPVSVNPKKSSPRLDSTRPPITMAPKTTVDPPVNPVAEPTIPDEPLYDAQGENSEYGTQSVLPSGTGSLMDRKLPPPPTSLTTVKNRDDAVNNIEPNELIIISSNMDEARQLANQLSEYGLSAKKRKILKYLSLVITTYRVPADVDLQQTANNIRQAYPDMWADVNHRYTLQTGNHDADTEKKLINWSKGNQACGKGLRLGLIDTGIYTDHPALKTQKIISHSVITQGINKADKNHGTAIATLLVGSQKVKSFSGMLPSAELFSVSVFRQRDKHNIDTTAEWIVSAIDWLLSQKVDVINISIGGPRNLLVDVSIQRTIKSGIPVIAAVGNSGPDASDVYPAAQPGVIAVTAVDTEMNLYIKANHGKYIDFAAPGVAIWAGNETGTGEFVSGTSFSVPFVTASIASIIKNLGPKQAYSYLQQHAKDLGKKGKDDQFGWGLIQTSAICQ